MKTHKRINTSSRFTYKGFLISYEDKTVTIEHTCHESKRTWDDLLTHGREIRAKFNRTQPGSDWGCDGIGYDIQKKHGHVLLMRSGVSMPTWIEVQFQLKNEAK